MDKINQEILERYFNGKYSAEDEKYVMQVFADENKQAALKTFMAHQWHKFAENAEITDKNLAHILHKIHYNINIEKSVKDKQPLKRIIRFYYRAAAVILLPLIIAGSIMFYLNTTHNDKVSDHAFSEIRSTLGSRVSFILPDGTKGWLNSGSTLRYSLNYKQYRRVELQGEAYFDVKADKQHPFYVNTAEVQFKVLGTKFNIRSYAEDKIIEATLLTGLLEIQPISQERSKKPPFILKPNQKATFFKTTGDMALTDKKETGDSREKVGPVEITKEIDTAPIVAWKDNKLVFVSEPFESLLVKMERWYNVEITLLDTAINNLSYTGVFEKETVEQALRALKVATPNFDYTINKNKIEVSLKK
jgi:ferric-dicitrate binding protein FerR (iron transport regulator)